MNLPEAAHLDRMSYGCKDKILDLSLVHGGGETALLGGLARPRRLRTRRDFVYIVVNSIHLVLFKHTLKLNTVSVRAQQCCAFINLKPH